MTAADDSEPTPRRCRPGKKNKDGLPFVACEGTPYLSLDYHQSSSGTRHQKSIWSLTRPDECHTFCESRLNAWADSDGNYWSVAAEKSEDFGTRGQRMAFFPVPTNETDTWHGYPIGRKNEQSDPHDPPTDLVQLWRDQGRISRMTRARIIQRQL